MNKKRKIEKVKKVQELQKTRKPPKRIQKVHTPDGLEESKDTNTFKISYNESKILLDFGQATYTDDEMDIEVVSRLTFPPDGLRNLISDLFLVGVRYEKEFKKDIGFDIDKLKSNSETP